MRDTDWTPSIVPGDEDRDVCLVVSDFGRRGRAYCETDVEATDLETVIQDLRRSRKADYPQRLRLDEPLSVDCRSRAQ